MIYTILIPIKQNTIRNTILPTGALDILHATTPHPRGHVHRRVGNPGVARDVASLASFDRVVPVIVCLSRSLVDRYYINDILRESASKLL